MQKSAILFLLAALVAGCASSSTINYEMPETNSIENTAVIDGSFDQVWDRTVRNLSSDFFVINNIDKESRIMNVSFGTSTPTDFIDCGVTNRTFTDGSGGTQSTRYETANSASFWEAYSDNFYSGLPMAVERLTSLDGRVNVYIAPLNSNQTEIRVNARYVWEAQVSAQVYDEFQNRPVAPPQTTLVDVSFNTGQEGRSTSGEVICRANGELERRILGAARGA